jgi:chromosome segregation ATPase
MFPKINFEYARMYKRHLAWAYKKTKDRDQKVEDLKLQLKQLQRSSRSSSKKSEVQEQLNTILSEEKALEHNLHDDLELHRQLLNKIDELDGKLQRFMSSKNKRSERSVELEQKVFHRMASQDEKLRILKADLAALKKLHREVRKEKHPKIKLNKIKERIKKVEVMIRRL